MQPIPDIPKHFQWPSRPKYFRIFHFELLLLFLHWLRFLSDLHYYRSLHRITVISDHFSGFLTISSFFLSLSKWSTKNMNVFFSMHSIKEKKKVYLQNTVASGQIINQLEMIQPFSIEIFYHLFSINYHFIINIF